jgi:hypothetical protein
MTVAFMRYALSEVYAGVKWKRKVSAMADGQVIAVYYKFLAEKKLK